MCRKKMASAVSRDTKYSELEAQDVSDEQEPHGQNFSKKRVTPSRGFYSRSVGGALIVCILSLCLTVGAGCLGSCVCSRGGLDDKDQCYSCGDGADRDAEQK